MALSLEKIPDGRDGQQRQSPQPGIPTPGRDAAGIAQQAGQDAETGQQIGAAHDVGHRLGKHRVHRPESRHGERRGHLREQQQSQQVYQRDIDGVQGEVD
jgi:hypothetical protein